MELLLPKFRLTSQNSYFYTAQTSEKLNNHLGKRNTFYCNFNNRSSPFSQGSQVSLPRHETTLQLSCPQCCRQAARPVTPFKHPHPLISAHPRSEMNITTPMNWVNSNSGVKNDHTFHKATLKQIPAAMNVAVVMGTSVGYWTS